jgi:hypothetical protein
MRYMRQSVQFTGLSTPDFQTCIDNIRRIHAMYARNLPDGALENFVPSKYNHHDCIDTGNRYFTSRRDEPSGRSVLFSKAVDPRNILGSLTDGDFFHGIDNEVLYYGLKSIAHEGKHSQCV